MVDVQDSSTSDKIRNFLMVIFAAVFGAFILAGGLILYYNPEGSYQVADILLAPSVAKNLTYPEMDPATGKPVRYTFSRVELVYYDDAKHAWAREQVPFDRYTAFYDLITNIMSTTFVSEDIKGEFVRTNPTTLTLVVRKEGVAKDMQEAQAFQEVQFVPDTDLFRIQSRTEGTQPNWVYYQSPGIYKQVVKTLIP